MRRESGGAGGETVVFDPDEVEGFARAALERAGADPENAGAVARTVAAAERHGSPSHGLFRLPGYIASLKSGKVNPRARARVERIAPGVLRVDGDGGYAPLALEAAVGPLAEAAREQGAAAAAVVETHHFAGLWHEVEALARAGLVGFACTPYKPVMAPAGGTRPLFGTNPIAFAWPRPGREPMVFDMATSVMARGEVMIARREGRRLPEGAGIGPDGRPSTDPGEVLAGAQLPFGGHKGSALALMVELLSACLLGQDTSPAAERRERGSDSTDGGPPVQGELLLALDPARFGAASSWAGDAEALFAELVSQEGARLPGDRRLARRERVAREGARVPASLVDAILEALGAPRGRLDTGARIRAICGRREQNRTQPRGRDGRWQQPERPPRAPPPGRAGSARKGNPPRRRAPPTR